MFASVDEFVLKIDDLSWFPEWNEKDSSFAVFNPLFLFPELNNPAIREVPSPEFLQTTFGGQAEIFLILIEYLMGIFQS